eukprot:g22478.t1
MYSERIAGALLKERSLCLKVYILDSPDLAQCPCVSVLTVAAQDLQRVKPFSPELLQQKLRTTLRMAAEHGNNAVVLGAFGCGYFGNPPEAVATTFQELLTSEFHGTFHLAVFALLRDRNFATFVKWLSFDLEGGNVDKATNNTGQVRYFTVVCAFYNAWALQPRADKPQ